MKSCRSIVALVSPFDDGVVDLESLGKLIEFQISRGTDGIVVCGSTGEGVLLDEDERNQVVKLAVQRASGRVKVICGCSSASTREAVRFVESAEEAGVDAVLVTAPYYVKPTQQGIIEHFAEIHNNSSVDIIMYNNPGRCSVNMECDTVVFLSEMERIVGFKESNTDVSRIIKIKKDAENLAVFAGDDLSLVEFLENGADGAISVVANVVPELVKSLIDWYKDGKRDESLALYKNISELNKILCAEPNPIPVKFILSEMGMCKNELRSPLTKLPEKLIHELNIESVLLDFGIGKLV